MDITKITRRQALGVLGAGTALATLPGCARTLAGGAPGSADALLDDIAFNLLKHEPERATSLGVDTGAYAYLRGQLEDQSPAGQDALAATLRSDLARVQAFPKAGLDIGTLTNLEVVASAYDIALEGLALPYGDVPVGSWRTAPYAVIQNVGTYLDMPRFLDANHKVESAADADAYIERLQQMPAVLDGELARIRSARGMGVTPPSFLLDKAMGQMEQTIASAGKGELFAASLGPKLAKAGLDERYAARALALESGPIAEALSRQLEELRAERSVASDRPGISSRPQGEEFYA